MIVFLGPSLQAMPGMTRASGDCSEEETGHQEEQDASALSLLLTASA